MWVCRADPILLRVGRRSILRGQSVDFEHHRCSFQWVHWKNIRKGIRYDSPRVYLQSCSPEYRLLPVSTALRLGHATSTLATSKPRRDRGRHNTYVRTLTTKTTAFRVLVQRVGEHEYVVSINRFNQNVIDGNQCATHCRSSRRTPN